MVLSEANRIANESTEILNLENKIVLSIATRLLAEKFMISKIDNDEKVNDLTSNQTGKLFDYYKDSPSFNGTVNNFSQI